MPIAKIWNLSADYLDAAKTVSAAIRGIWELGLTKETDVTVLIPSCVILKSSPTSCDIVVEISGLFVEPRRTDAVLERLVAAVGQAMSKMFPEARVECLVSTINPQYVWLSD